MKVGDPRGRRHDMATVRTVRRMYDNGNGWGKTAIREELARHGIDVSYSTISRWVSESFAERCREDNRRRMAGRRPSFRWPTRHNPTWKLGRMRALRATGLSSYDIARVMNFDFPQDPPITDYVVRRILKTPEDAEELCRLHYAGHRRRVITRDQEDTHVRAA